ncbi:odorant receptor 131-2-like, partial [Lates calcarifer]|uniref:Odorant receptor 131-2-like n=1 Tax=Lates calcarifer TaxID=8187 RepID=A0AAJ8DMQ1_LATCA
MAANNSLADFLPRKVKLIIVQILVMIFLCINLVLIMTFFKRECFHTSARYILFAVTLLSDSLLLFMSDILLILTIFRLTIQVWLCIIISVVLLLYATVTPVTLTAMTLERYVAICMPLRHGELCSTRSTMHCILIIHGLSSWPKLHQERIKSQKKGLRTVILHGFQLLLCLIQLWTPFIEAAVLQVNFSLFENVRYFNYIMFYFAPRCLSPLIYGLRDEVFFHALKNCASFG